MEAKSNTAHNLSINGNADIIYASPSFSAPRPVISTLGLTSMGKRFSLITLFVLYSTSCFAVGEQAVIAHAFPKASVLDSSVGTIDGTTHLAALVWDESMFMTIGVFEMDHNGKYKLRTMSKQWPRHQRWYSTTIKIKNDSIYFALSGNGGCCSDYHSQYQFKRQNGKFTLIGVETSSNGIESESDNNDIAIEGKYISYKYGSSINYLSGIVSHWRIQAVSSSSSPFKDDISMTKRGKKRVERQFRFAPPQNLLLENFDVFADSVDHPKHVSGYFDQRFKYHE